jgi:hypothetical protein
MHTYIYIYGLTVSPGLPHHGLVFGTLVSKCLHADPLSGLKGLHFAPFLPHFFDDHSFIVSHVIVLYFLVEFLSIYLLYAEKNIKRNKSPWDTQNLESEVNQSIQYGGEYILAFVVPSKKSNVFVDLIYRIHSPNLHLFSPCHKHWNMLTGKKYGSLIPMQNIILLTKLDSSFCIPSCRNDVLLIASMLNVLNL